MSCAEILRTQAFIDGEVADEDAEAIERHIEGCADCQAFCTEAAALSDDIRRLAPRHAAPAPLRRRIEASLDEQGRQGSLDRERPKALLRPGFWSGAFSGAGVAALAASLAIVAMLPPSAGALADKVMDAHTRALIQGHEIEVVSSDHHTVKPWFAGRIALSPPVADFAARGFTLAGGRLDRIGAAPAAVVVYWHGHHRIDLFVWTDHGSTLPAEQVRHGYHAIFWKRQDLDFAAVSDTSAPELASFVSLVRAEPE